MLLVRSTPAIRLESQPKISTCWPTPTGLGVAAAYAKVVIVHVLWSVGVLCAKVFGIIVETPVDKANIATIKIALALLFIFLFSP